MKYCTPPRYKAPQVRKTVDRRECRMWPSADLLVRALRHVESPAYTLGHVRYIPLVWWRTGTVATMHREPDRNPLSIHLE